jgi:oxygen-independent coproporphyrinogen-3 oxidase
MRIDTLPPLSLYLHLPWCVRKCPYCDFNSHESADGVPGADYIAALLRDLDAELDLAQGRTLQSIFIGGGTPSLFSGEAIRRLLDGIRERIAVRDEAEVTLEANPGTAESGRFADYRDAGVKRLSIGVQSFRDAQLVKLGRIHSAAEALRAYDMARRAGFENINLDLMYGLPDDSPGGALQDLRTAVALAVPHLSWYQLTLEPNTAFHRQPPILPDDDTIIEIEEAGRVLLAEHGYARYEVSAYAMPGQRCAHNLNYWQFGDYLGIGAGAHGKITLADCVLRRARQRNPRMYMRRAGTTEAVTCERIESRSQLTVEFFMNALRLTDGIELSLFEARTGLSRLAIEAAVSEAGARGLLIRRRDTVRPSELGMRYLNDLIALFDVPPADGRQAMAV